MQHTTYPEPYTYLTDAVAAMLGIYVGPASRDEVMEAIDGHEYRTAIVVLASPDGVNLLFTSGALYQAFEEGEPLDSFYIGGQERPNDTFTGRIIENYSAGLSLPDQFEAERWTGGVRLLLGEGYSLTLVFWQDVYHSTPSGDLAPGIGAFHVTRFDKAGDDFPDAPVEEG